MGKEALKMVGKDGYALQYVKEQTSEICLEAVRQDGLALEFVWEQTEEICLAAVNRTPNAIICVKDKSMLKNISKPESYKLEVRV